MFFYKTQQNSNKAKVWYNTHISRKSIENSNYEHFLIILEDFGAYMSALYWSFSDCDRACLIAMIDSELCFIFFMFVHYIHRDF